MISINGILAAGERLIMNRKTMYREDWTRILEKEVIIRDFQWKGVSGKISLLKIKKIRSPLSVDYLTEKVKIVDTGYSWVQFALEGQYYWVTSMFDEQDRLVQIYIDMTDGNVTDIDDPYFDDLYLDFVVHGDAVLEMDRDELTNAFEKGLITKEQYERTIREGNHMLRYLRENHNELAAVLISEQRKLKYRDGSNL